MVAELPEGEAGEGVAVVVAELHRPELAVGVAVEGARDEFGDRCGAGVGRLVAGRAGGAVDAVHRGVVAGGVAGERDRGEAGCARSAWIAAARYPQLHARLGPAVAVEVAACRDPGHRVAAAVPDGTAGEHLMHGDHRVGQPGREPCGVARVSRVGRVEGRLHGERRLVDLVGPGRVGRVAIVGVELGAQDPAAQAAQRLADLRAVRRTGDGASVEVGLQRRVAGPVVAGERAGVGPVPQGRADRAEMEPGDRAGRRAVYRDERHVEGRDPGVVGVELGTVVAGGIDDQLAGR